MSTFDEALHPRGTAGQFATKENSAPASALAARVDVEAAVAPVTSNGADQIKSAREDAELVLAQAKSTADGLRAEHAAAVLREAFPNHTLAVFTRAWDEDEPTLYQLLSDRDGIEDIGLDEDGEKLTREQSAACAVADRAIRLIGTDDDIWEHLDSSEEPNDDWCEFQLPLRSAP